jgi:hypothetical protein
LLIALSSTFRQIQFAGELTLNPLNWVYFIPVLLGSAFQFFYIIPVPILIGSLIFFVFILALFMDWYKKSTYTFLMLTFLIFSALAAAPFRSANIPGVYYALETRYGFFSIIATALALMLLIENVLSFRKKFKLLFLSALVYNLLSGIFFYPEVPARTQKLIKLEQDAGNSRFSLEYSPYQKEEFDVLMSTAKEKGIYKPNGLELKQDIHQQ